LIVFEMSKHSVYWGECSKSVTISFIGKGDFLLSEIGEEFDKCLSRYISRVGHFPTEIHLDLNEYITSIDPAFIEKLDTLKVVEFFNVRNMKDIPVLPKFRENNLLIVGDFDSYAERFALKNDLHFRPMGVYIACITDKNECNRTAYLKFSDDGRLMLKDEWDELPSSGGCGGCPPFDWYDLGRDIQSITVETVVNKLPTCLQSKASSSETLRKFLHDAKTHKMYFDPA